MIFKLRLYYLEQEIFFKDEVSPETSFDPGEASANVELPKDSFVAQVAAHLSGQRL